MIEIKARCHCSTPQCEETLEYWATLDVVEKDCSDSYESRTRPEISVSGPPVEEGWTSEGSWTTRMYCPKCSLSRRQDQRKK